MQRSWPFAVALAIWLPTCGSNGDHRSTPGTGGPSLGGAGAGSSGVPSAGGRSTAGAPTSGGQSTPATTTGGLDTGGTTTGGVATNGGFPSIGGTTSTGGTATFTITIRNLAFSPLDLRVPPGATINVVNQDTAPHSVTSESAKGNFTFGDVNGVSFDTGSFGTGTASFTISPSAPSGTVVPYYCRVHLAIMTEGTVTIE